MKTPSRLISLTGIAGVALVLAACNGSSDPNPNPNPEPEYPEGPPVPTGDPNAEGQEPAFPEQTRAPAMTSNVTPVRTVVTTELDNPWGMVFLPDGRLLVTELGGEMHIVSSDGSVSAPIAGVPAVAVGGQGGLLDVTLGPDFEQSRMVYISYSEARDGNKNGTTVARARLADNEQSLENLEVIFRQTPAWDSDLHFGSRLVFDNDGYLFVTLGERSHPQPRQLAQDIDTTLGKVVRLNPDGSAPDTNPFVNNAGLDEIWSYGHRNPQGAAIHPTTGELWTIEHGPRGGDELNQPKAGRNYGWPVITYGEEYSGQPVGQGITEMEGMEQPVYYWDPVIAPSDMVFYDGDMFEEWQGNILVGGLAGQVLVRLWLDAGMIRGEEHLYKGDDRIRDVDVAPDGSVWYLTTSGKMYRLSL